MSLFSFAGTLRLAASKLMCRVGIMSCEGGTCCGGQWHEAESEGTQSSCAEGLIYLRWGPADNCCGCVPAQIFDPRANALVDTVDVKDDLCCPVYEGKWLPFDPITADYIGCLGRCCSDGYCIDLHEVACVSTGRVWLEGRCDPEGCPVDCCAEDSDGNVTCATVDSALLCTTPKVLADPDCASGCLGQCCLDDENGNPHPQGMMTQGDCDAIGGNWQGLGKMNCAGCPCRDPFDCSCCESVTSTAAGITFFQPRRKRSPQFTDTFRVTVTGRTESSIYVHGVPVGASCDFEVTFVLCHDSFHIEPVECGTNFKKLTVKVCWEEEHTSGETLEIRGCEHGTIAVGSCRPGGCSGSGECVSPGAECTTTLLHNENGATTDAAIAAYGRLTIDSSGTGALVLTGDITVSECSMTLVITGTNDDLNRIDGDILQQASTKPVIVEKRGSGTWGLAGANTYTGQLRILEGTLVVLADVDSGYGTNPSPFGKTPSPTVYPVVGGDASNTITAAMLLADGVTIERAFTVPANSAQTVVLGGYSGTSSVASSVTPTLMRDVTLQAATGATCTFNNQWASAAVRTITFGSAGNTGTVVINQGLGLDWPIVVAFGTAKMGTSDAITSSPVTVDDAVLDLDGTSQEVPTVTFTGSGGLITGGTLTIGYSGTAEVDVAGAEHEIASDVTLGDDATFTIDDDSDLTVSGVVSGAFAITKEGDGTLTLSGANSYTGDTRVSAGTLAVQDADALAGTTLNMNTGDSGSVTFSQDSNIGGLKGGRNLSNGGSTLTVGGSDASTIYSGVLSGPGGLVKVGSGTLTLAGSNTYSGQTTISNGTLSLSGTLNAASVISIGAATLACVGAEKSANSVVCTGAATITGAIVVGELSGAGSLVKSGGGAMTLTSASILGGSVSITGGSLVLDEIVSGPPKVTAATFTPSSLQVVFSSEPTSGDQYKLLTGSTVQTYATVTLTGTTKTGSYNSATSTLTIN